MGTYGYKYTHDGDIAMIDVLVVSHLSSPLFPSPSLPIFGFGHDGIRARYCLLLRREAIPSSDSYRRVHNEKDIGRESKTEAAISAAASLAADQTHSPFRF